MAIFDKPFSFSEMLRLTKFKGRPNFFNAKDFNKELLILHKTIEEFNKVFAVWSDIKFKVTSFAEQESISSDTINRNLKVSWGDSKVMYKGVTFTVNGGGIESFTQTYDKPNEDTHPKEVKPPTYIVLRAKLATVTYADNPILCGIQSNEIPNTVPTVDVEQYQDVSIAVVSGEDLVLDGGIEADGSFRTICVLGTIHAKYKPDGSFNGFGFLYNVFNNPDFKLYNGQDNEVVPFECNKTLYEYILERVTTGLENVLNERQLVRRFNLADLTSSEKARHNIGLSKLLNHEQLVRDENLNDVPDKPASRYNLGLGNSATRNIGTGGEDVAPGNVLPKGVIAMWSGASDDIPSGWTLCNGSNSTPDLRGRFIVGIDPTKPEFDVLGASGGKISNTITEDNLPEHAHNFGAGGVGIVALHVGGTQSGAQRYSKDKNIQSTDISKTQKAGGVSNPEKLDNLPPYYALSYIMYLGTTIEPPTPPEAQEELDYPNYSEPTEQTDGGAISYTPSYIGGSDGETVGSGITVTNPQ